MSETSDFSGVRTVLVYCCIHPDTALQDHTGICGARWCCPVCCAASGAMLAPEIPKPKPGVTVMLYSERCYHYWGATLAGTPTNEFRVISHSTNHGLEESPVLSSYEEAKAHFLLRTSEFVSRVTGRPCAPRDLQNITFREA